MTGQLSLLLQAKSDMNEETEGRHLLVQLPTKLSCLLTNPSRGRVARTTSQMDPSTAEFDEKEHVQGL
jgi:hypothetical protein